MNATVTIDRAGRVVLPKSFREELRLEAGDTLELEFEGGRVILRPVRSSAPLRKERGVWVFHGGQTLSVEDTTQMIGEVRARRDHQNVHEK